MNRRVFVSVLSAVAVLGASSVVSAADNCQVVAEVSVELAAQGALLVCLKTGNPPACAVAAASRSVATKGVAKHGVASGCRWFVKKFGDKLVIKIEGPLEKKSLIGEAGKSLDAIPGVRVEK